jgi:hypothetical protein
VRVYVLRLRDPASLSRAFGRLMASSRVGSCLVEPELGRVRFAAPPRVAEAMVERIYLDGELLWCSRHDLRPLPTRRADDAPAAVRALHADADS